MRSRYQRARCYAYWRGFALALFVFSLLSTLGGLAGQITS